MDLISGFRPQCMGIWGFEFDFNNIVYGGNTGLLEIMTKPCCELWRNETLQNCGFKCEAEEWHEQNLTNNDS